jgi:hypothetical protein
MQKKLTELQAFNAVGRLLQMYFDKKPSGDLATILASMSFLQDKKTVDRGMWNIWIRSLDKVLKYKNLHDYNHLTILQSFFAMGLYLEDFLGTEDLDEYVEFLECNVRNARDKKPVDPILWQNWLQCVDEVLAVEDSREYFYLLPKD